MASSARIDELRKKFDENPRRYFAPLANEYRKVGDLEQAIFICQEYLPQQPGHMSGHIVYGQALFEAARHEEARAVFETALGLDPENLIALRHLGDIARLAGDVAAARAWYQRVLEADPRNEEIANVLGEIAAGGTPPDVTIGEASAPGAESAAGEAEPWAIAAAPGSPQTGGHEQGGGAPLQIEQTPDRRSDDLLDVSGFDLAERPEPSAATARAETAPSAAAESTGGVERLDGLEAMESGARHNAAAGAPVMEGLEVAETMTSAADLAPAPSAAPVDGGHEAAESGEPRADQAHGNAAAPAEIFVTETMAQLYLQQGHLQAAVDTYRRLIVQRPDDDSLRVRLAEAEAQLRGPGALASEAGTSGPTIREFLAELFRGRATASPTQEPTLAQQEQPEATPEAVHGNGATPPGAMQVLAASATDAARPARPIVASAPMAPHETLSGSVDALFADVKRKPEDEQAAMALAQAFAAERRENLPLRGMPARRASDELSLDHVFKSKTPARGEASAFSFDQFFADGGQQSPVATSEHADEPPSDSDDVAQFSAWLNGLKKS